MSQSLAKVYVHAIFSTLNRFPCLADAWRGELFHVVGGTCNKHGCQSLIVGGVADHLHMLFQLSRTMSIAQAIGKVKAAASGWINAEQRLPGRFEWQAGYAAFSVSPSKVESVREYIRNQPQHHATQSFQDELRGIMRRYGIEWDERYVWK
jgi:putative transposase